MAKKLFWRRGRDSSLGVLACPFVSRVNFPSIHKFGTFVSSAPTCPWKNAGETPAIRLKDFFVPDGQYGRGGPLELNSARNTGHRWYRLPGGPRYPFRTTVFSRYDARFRIHTHPPMGIRLGYHDSLNSYPVHRLPCAGSGSGGRASQRYEANQDISSAT